MTVDLISFDFHRERTNVKEKQEMCKQTSFGFLSWLILMLGSCLDPRWVPRLLQKYTVTLYQLPDTLYWAAGVDWLQAQSCELISLKPSRLFFTVLSNITVWTLLISLINAVPVSSHCTVLPTHTTLVFSNNCKINKQTKAKMDICNIQTRLYQVVFIAKCNNLAEGCAAVMLGLIPNPIIWCAVKLRLMCAWLLWKSGNLQLAIKFLETDAQMRPSKCRVMALVSPVWQSWSFQDETKVQFYACVVASASVY